MPTKPATNLMKNYYWAAETVLFKWKK